MKKIIILIYLIFPMALFGQQMTVTATITDADGQAWNNGSYAVTLSASGTAYYNGQVVPNAPQTGSLSSSGALSVSLYNTGTITPFGAQYQWSICPNASSSCSTFKTPVTTTNMSSILSSLVTAPRFPALASAFGYLDVEVTPIPQPGGQYFNVSDSFTRQWNGTAWQNASGSSGACPASTTCVLQNPTTPQTIANATGGGLNITGAAGDTGTQSQLKISTPSGDTTNLLTVTAQGTTALQVQSNGTTVATNINASGNVSAAGELIYHSSCATGGGAFELNYGGFGTLGAPYYSASGCSSFVLSGWEVAGISLIRGTTNETGITSLASTSAARGDVTLDFAATTPSGTCPPLNSGSPISNWVIDSAGKISYCMDGTGSWAIYGGGGGGSGTVTSFSAGNLSPLFTSSVATGTTTPALTFTASTAAQNSFLAGPSSGGTGAYYFRAITPADVPTLNQNTTGTSAGITGLTQAEPVVGNASGVSVSSPVYYDVSQFAGSTIDAKWNACNTQVLFEGGGTCDARSLALLTTGGSTGLLVGDSSGTPIEFILPTFCNWGFTINNGTASVITQYAGTSITNYPGIYGCVMTQTTASTSGSTGAYSMYKNVGQDYFRAEGFTLENSVALSSGFNGLISYAYDNSVWKDIEFNDASGSDTAGLRIGLTGGGIICCSTSFYNITSNSGFTGPTPLDIEDFSSSSYVTSLNFFGGSFDHPKSGVPNIKINDAYHNLSAAFSGFTYAEPGNTAGSVTTIPIQISGAAVVSFQALNVVPQYAGMTAAVMSIAASGATNTTVNIGSFSSNGLLGAHTVVADSGGWCTFAGATPPCNTSTDIYGNMGSYSNAPTTSLHPVFPLNTQIGSTSSAGFVFTNTYYGIPSGWASVYPFYAGIDVQGNAASSSANSEFGVSNTSDAFGGHGVGGNEFNVTANRAVTTYYNTIDNGAGAATLVSLQNTPIGGTTASTGRFTTVTSTATTGTAPFTVASTTQVTNLNASALGGVALSGLCQTGGTGCPGLSVPGGTPSYIAGTGVTSVACASGYTCTNTRGELTIVGGTATTGTIATVSFSAALSAAPGMCIVTQNGGVAALGIGHGTPSTTAFTITTGIAGIATTTIAVDYSCTP